MQGSGHDLTNDTAKINAGVDNVIAHETTITEIGNAGEEVCNGQNAIEAAQRQTVFLFVVSMAPWYFREIIPRREVQVTSII